MGVKISIGDVFTIPLSENDFGLGQVVDVLGAELYLIAFAEVWGVETPPNADSVLSLKPHFATLSLDAKLWNGDWEIIGNVTGNLNSIRRPLFKIRQRGVMFVESQDGTKARPAKSDELEQLRFRGTVSPIRIQKAVQAQNGIIEWNEMFDELRYSYAESSSALEI